MAHPVTLELDAPPEIDRWRPLVQWLLAVPHLLIAGALGSVSSAVAVVSWFFVVFTGRLPAELADLQAMILRYSLRAYSYAFWLRSDYPAFAFTLSGPDPGGDPVRVDVTPATEERDRLTAALRIIWLIPAAVFAALVQVAATVALLIAFFAVLVTGRWPDGLRRFVVGAARVSLRTSAYAYLLHDEYPPFSLD